MAIWSYACHPCDDNDTTWFVAQASIEDFPPETAIVRVKVGKLWRCARLDRSQRISAEGLLVRNVIATEASNCEDCEDQ